MKKSFVITLVAFVTLFFFQSVSFAEDRSNQYGHYVSSVEVPQGLELSGVQKSIVKAGLGRRWVVTTKADGIVVLKLIHRGYDSTLTFLYNASEVKVYSDSWTISKKGKRKKQKDPEGWIKNLEKDISVFMERAVTL